jgi:hypothetical protein
MGPQTGWQACPWPTRSLFAAPPTSTLPDPCMPLTKAAQYRAYAAASLANADEALDKAKRDVHLAIARHFYRLAEEEIGPLEAKHPMLQSVQSRPARPGS